MFISEDGKTKVEIIWTTCVDPIVGEIAVQQYKVMRWGSEEKDSGWYHVIATANPHILAHHVNLDELTEFPSPGWEDDAMEVKHE